MHTTNGVTQGVAGDGENRTLWILRVPNGNPVLYLGKLDALITITAAVTRLAPSEFSLHEDHFSSIVRLISSTDRLAGSACVQIASNRSFSLQMSSRASIMMPRAAVAT